MAEFKKNYEQLQGIMSPFVEQDENGNGNRFLEFIVNNGLLEGDQMIGWPSGRDNKREQNA